MSTLLIYRLTAFDQKDNVNQLHNIFLGILSTQVSIPIKNVISLMPLDFSALRQLLSRQYIKYDSVKKISANYSIKQTIKIGDPALGQMYLTVPAICEAVCSYFSDELIMNLSTGFEIQINKLAEGGANRSAYQKIKSFTFETNVFTTVLEDKFDSSKVTHLVVYLKRESLNIENEKSSQTEKIKSLNMSLLNGVDIGCCKGVDVRYGTSPIYWVAVYSGGREPYCAIIKRNDNEGAPVDNYTRPIKGFNTREEAINFASNSNQCKF